MAHTTRYSFKGQARLAQDAGVERSTISRLIAGRTRPSFSLIFTIAELFEQQLGVPLDPRELISVTGSYRTPSVCALCGCTGCLPAEAYDENDCRRETCEDMQPGQWMVTQSGCIGAVFADTS